MFLSTGRINPLGPSSTSSGIAHLIETKEMQIDTIFAKYT